MAHELRGPEVTLAQRLAPVGAGNFVLQVMVRQPHSHRASGVRKKKKAKKNFSPRKNKKGGSRGAATAWKHRDGARASRWVCGSEPWRERLCDA